MSVSYMELHWQSISTAKSLLGAAISAIKKEGLEPTPRLIAAFMHAAVTDFDTMVKAKIEEARYDE